MNFKRLSLVAVQAIGLGLLPSAAFAATDTTFFRGVVPGACTITGAGTSSSSPKVLDYSTDADGTLSGTSAAIGINCNTANINATLSGVDQTGNPTGTAATAILRSSDNEDLITVTDSTSASTDLQNGNGSTFNYTVVFTATGADAPGTYNYSVVLTTLE